MRQYIMGIAIILLCSIVMIYSQDDVFFLKNIQRVKFIAEEATAAAVLYYDSNEFSEGHKVFNRIEATKAAEYIIKSNMRLDNSFMPDSNSYWQDQIKYEILFFDDSNTTFPILYTDPDNDFTIAIGDPTIIVRINPGRARYRLITTQPIVIRTAAHEWKSY